MITLNKKNVYSVLHNQNFRVYYKFNQQWLLLKPLMLSLTVFVFYLLAIIGARLKLSFDESPKQKTA
jgi:Ribophorin I